MSRLGLLLQASSLFFHFLAHQTEGVRVSPTIQQENDDPLGQDELYGLFKRKLLRLKSNTNGTIIPRDSSEPGVIKHFAVHVSPIDNYYGLHATMDLYGHTLKPGQQSVTGLWVAHTGDGAESSMNTVQAGWHIFPELYGDSHPHFFTYWTRDGYDKTGCFNLNCPGFIRANGTIISPGALIHPVSDAGDGKLQNVTIRVLKENISGDWWVYYGFNTVPTAVGYYPRSLFTYMSDHANLINFGAYAIADRALPTPPMGAGVNPKGAGPGHPASFTDLRFIDQEERSRPIMIDLPVDVSNEKCYSITPVYQAKCFYGGPGGCVG